MKGSKINRHRVKSHDYYARGIYLITLVVANRQPILGQLNKSRFTVDLSLIGEIINQEWENIPKVQADKDNKVRVLNKQVMPDHFHGILFIEDTLTNGLGAVIAAFKAACTKEYQKIVTNRLHEGNIEALPASPFMAMTPLLTSEQLHQMGTEQREAYYQKIRQEGCTMNTPLFERNYDATILMHPGQLTRMIEYVHDNPRRAILRQQHPDLFSLRRNIAIPTEEGISLTFSSMGNLFLADYPIKQTVICSRSLQADQISAICQEALYRAEEGAVTITGAISEGERTIARAIREAGWPLIVLLTNGFPAEGTDEARHYKPGGVYFDACCEGRLLLLEPTNEALEQEEVVSRTDEALRLKAEDRGNAYTPLPHDTQRWHYMAVNTIAQLMGD